MTKMKSKKMTKSTFAIIIMAIVMVAMLAFGGTYAYFTATSDKNVASLTTGMVSLESATTLTATVENVMPKEEVFAAGDLAFNTSASTEDTYLGFELIIQTRPAGSDNSVAYTTLTTAQLAEVGLELNFAAAWKETDEAAHSQKYVQMSPVAPAAKVVLNDQAIVFDAEENNSDLEEDTELTVMGKEIKITFKGYAIQSTKLSESGYTLNTAAGIWEALTTESAKG